MTMFYPGSQGISGKVGNKARWHIPARFWGDMPGSDFWFSPYDADIITASAPALLAAANGWTSNGTLDIVAENQANTFLSTTIPSTIGGLRFNGASERIQSPIQFGGIAHQHWIREQLGWTPSRLIADFYGQFSTSSNNEAGSGFGFVKGSINTATNGVAVIASDGTNFRAKTTATDFTGAMTGALVDTAAHLWRIVLSNTGVFFYMDGAVMGTSMTLPTSVFPCAFSAGDSTSNVVLLGMTHIYYD